jgi:hypothetical protein
MAFNLQLQPTPKRSPYVQQLLEPTQIQAFSKGPQIQEAILKALSQGFKGYFAGRGEREVKEKQKARGAELASMIAGMDVSQDPRIAMGPVQDPTAYAPRSQAQRLQHITESLAGSEDPQFQTLGMNITLQKLLEEPTVDYSKILAEVPTHMPDIRRQVKKPIPKEAGFGKWDQRTALEDGGGEFEVVAGQPLSAVQRLIAEQEAITKAGGMTPELSLKYATKIDALGKRDIRSVGDSLIDVTDADNPQVIYHSSKDGRDIRSVPGVGLFDFNDIDSEGMPRLIVESLIRGRYRNLGPYLDSNGKYLGEGTIDTATTDLNARRFLEKWDPETKLIVKVPIPPDAQPRTEGYFNLGVPTFGQFGKLKEDLVGDETSLLNLASYLGNQDTSEIGWRRVADQLSAWYKTFFSSNAKRLDLTEKELALRVAGGELEGLLGKFRIETVGGGVMTEIDALRIIRNLGGTVSALQNPEVLQRQVSRLFVNKHRLYTSHLEQYNAAVEARYKDLGHKRKTSITEGERAINIDLFDEKLLSEAGITNTVQIDWSIQKFGFGDVVVDPQGNIQVWVEDEGKWMPSIMQDGIIVPQLRKIGD